MDMPLEEEEEEVRVCKHYLTHTRTWICLLANVFKGMCMLIALDMCINIIHLSIGV